MRYDLIWKELDKEISEEEKSLLNDEFNTSVELKEYQKDALEVQNALYAYVNPTMDVSFLARLKKRVIEELEIPKLKIDHKPGWLFLLVVIVIIGVSIAMNLKGSFVFESPIDTVYLNYFGLIALGGVVLYYVDCYLSKVYQS